MPFRWRSPSAIRFVATAFTALPIRYQMERYAQLRGKPVEELNLVTLHLESGCSATAIRKGKSIDNTMGLTPLEGLMMGARSGMSIRRSCLILPKRKASASKTS